MKKLSLLFAALSITVAMHAQLTASFIVTDNDPSFTFNNTSQGAGSSRVVTAIADSIMISSSGNGFTVEIISAGK